jgi:hypothetical protein
MRIAGAMPYGSQLGESQLDAPQELDCLAQKEVEPR